MSVTLRKFYESGNQVNDEPLITVFEDFLADREIEELLAAAQPKLKQALVSAAASGVKSVGRSGSNCWIPHNHNEVIADLSLRVSELVGIPLEHAESLQVVYYAASEEYAPHFDAWDAGTERGRRCLARGGQRLVTCLLYLNDPEQGGGTCFPRLDMQIQARRGRMLLFHNCFPNSLIRHPQSLHGGMPVTRGEKWACNFWFREKPYHASDAVPSRASSTGEIPKFHRVV